MKLCKQAKRYLSVQTPTRFSLPLRRNCSSATSPTRVSTTSKIGFSIAFTYCDPPFYGQVDRDGGRLNLRRVGEPVFVDGIREREQCFLRCCRWGLPPSIALFLEYRDSGVDFFNC